MSDLALPGSIEPAARKGPDLSGAIDPITGIIFGGIIAAVLLFVAYSIYSDIGDSGAKVTSYAPFLLLFVALLIALGFEFVNGFHDTANAVATVIYTRALPANFAVVWSGVFNLLGVLTSSGAVAFGIISLLARGVDPPGRQQRRFRHGVRTVDRRHPVEPRHLGLRPAGIELAHPDRLDHRRRRDECHYTRPRRHFGRRLG